MKLWMKIMIGLAAGIAVGAFLGPQAEPLKLLGTIFLGLINMLVVPLVLASMTVGITSIRDPKKLGRVGLKTLSMYLVTTVIAILIGIGFAYLIKPGQGLHLAMPAKVAEAGPSMTLKDVLHSLIPGNPIASLSEGNVLQIIVYSVFLGIAISFTGDKAKPLLNFLEALAETMYKLTSIVMEFAPFGVFGIMAWVSGTFGLAVLIPLAKFLLTNYLACTIQMVVVFCGILFFMAKVHPAPFFKGMTDAIAVAFTTNSSSATLPVSLHCAQRNLGISKNIAGFVLPLGSTVNMNGAAIFQGSCAVFIAQAYGLELSWQAIATIVVTASISAIGAAGIPGTGYVMMSVVLASVGLPLEGLAILAGIDRIREMLSTVVNILGDAVTAVWIAKKEGELDEAQYYHTELAPLEESDV